MLSLFDRPPSQNATLYPGIHFQLGSSRDRPVWKKMSIRLWQRLCNVISKSINLDKSILKERGDIDPIQGGNIHNHWDPAPKQCLGQFKISGVRNLIIEVELSTKYKTEETTESIGYLSRRILIDGCSLGVLKSISRLKSSSNPVCTMCTYHKLYYDKKQDV